MKFSWRANWEILLVLVIVVVGIVITTIAAIKNEDKGLLGVPEEADFGQLLAGATGQFADQPPSARLPPEVEDVPVHRRAPMAQRTQRPVGVGIRPQRPAAAGGLAERRPMAMSAEPELQRIQPGTSGQSLDSSSSSMAELQAAGYLEPSAVEPAPGRWLRQPSPVQLPVDRQSAGSGGWRSHQSANRSSSNQQMDGAAGQLINESQNSVMEPSSASNDDIHTTRSSLANQLAAEQQYQGASNEHQELASQQLYGPYSATPTSLSMSHIIGPPQAESTNSSQQSHRALLYGNHRHEQSLDSGESEPLGQTAFNQQAAKASQQQNLTELIWQNLAQANGSAALLSSLLSSAADQQEPLTNGNELLATVQQQLPLRAVSQRPSFAGTSPISMLFGDLIRLARPQQQQQQQQHSLLAGRLQLNETQRPSILQQLRSVPTPLIALLQGLSPTSGQQNDPLGAGYDASESSQHYHRVSMLPSEVHSILARSVQSSGVLPAFPAPRDVPQSWLPPTVGGNPDTHAVQNSKADFVASNAAGFVREQPAQQQQQQQSATGSEPQQVQSQQQPKSDGYGQRPTNLRQYYSQPTNQYPANQLTDDAQTVSQTSGLNQQNPGQWSAASGKQYQQQQGQQNLQLPRLSGVMSQAQTSNTANQAENQGLNMFLGAQAPVMEHGSRQQQQQRRDGLSSSPVYSSGNRLQDISFAASQLLARQSQQSAGLDGKTPAIPLSGARLQPRALNRKRRRVTDLGQEMERHQEEDEEDTEARPLSVVRPDGKPMDSGRLRSSSGSSVDRQAAQSSRKTNHLASDKRQANQLANGSGKRRPSRPSKRRPTNSGPMETASSGLMSKLLLGGASTMDETEEEADDDDLDSANERRKEELEDAEFGLGGSLGGDERQLHSGGRRDQESSSLPSSGGDSSSLGSNDNEAYARQQQNQQRSDIEFYGHPGEETRTLKYGILGSGNYEVVNGGIYPEADESTAAVNSVANYVRKPGGLAGALPKLLAGGGQQNQLGAAAGDAIQSAVAYRLPGSRISAATGDQFMRTSSQEPDDEMVGALARSVELAGSLGQQSARDTPPLLELIDAVDPSQLFDGSNQLMAHLGSSSRSTHAQRDEEDPSYGKTKNMRINKSNKQTRTNRISSGSGGREHDDEDSIDDELDGGEFHDGERLVGKRRKLTPNKQLSRQTMNKKHSNDNDNDNDDDKPNSSSGTMNQGTNQFNSYQILPSKKVTIFSDQDLDSAPSDMLMATDSSKLTTKS